MKRTSQARKRKGGVPPLPLAALSGRSVAALATVLLRGPAQALVPACEADHGKIQKGELKIAVEILSLHLPPLVDDEVRAGDPGGVAVPALAAQDRVGGDKKLLGELARLFQGECAKLLAAVHEAVTRRNLGALERAAHTLKSSLGNFAVSVAYMAAERPEILARLGELDKAAEASAVLVQEMARFQGELTDLGKEACA